MSDRPEDYASEEMLAAGPAFVDPHELAALRLDKARLEWSIENQWPFREPGGWTIWSDASEQFLKADSPRAAIDAAMRQEHLARGGK